MSIPEEYKILEVISEADNIITRKASHPIHGSVAIYSPKDGMPSDDAIKTKRFLYRCGTQMRSISLLDLPCIIETLEVSQNPNEPYIVTQFVSHDLDKLTNDGITLKPKRTFQIISQLLHTISSLSENGWHIDGLDLRQIRFNDFYKDDVTLAPIGNVGLGSHISETIASAPNKHDVAKPNKPEAQNDSGYANTIDYNKNFDSTVTIDHIDKTVTLQKAEATGNQSTGDDSTATACQEILQSDQSHIQMLGNLAFQLMLGKKYSPDDNAATVMLNKVGPRWRKILTKTLDQDIGLRYKSLDDMRSDIRNTLLIKKKIAVAAIPVLIAAMMIGGFFGYKQYKRRAIMTSDTATAVENLIERFDRVGSDTGADNSQSDDEILQPFEELEKADQ